MSEPDEALRFQLARSLVLTVHRRVLNPGDAEGILYDGNVDSIAYLLLTGRTVETRLLAGRVLHRGITRHGFMDGNHRTSYALAVLVLYDGGYRMSVPVEEAIRFTKSVDKNGLTEDRTVQWVRRYSTRGP